ncbi:Hypothetical predicted protein [Cloeon dipterum]|uniref:Kazal-like domain-containing protein n=1 Tax=Cloeon dipterum TaxID=197152 RepID=A0A8S1DMS4_9INSE|nr:Hypothetical predicted protein [Cloeon dipterum]
MRFALVCFVACMVLVGATAEDVSKRCYIRCNNNYNPVCGRNSKGETRTFTNQCHLDLGNCNGKNDFVKLKNSKC